MNELLQFLVERARANATCTYVEAANIVGLDMGSPNERDQLSTLLGEISTAEHDAGRPLLSAVVVHAADGIPGPGFFALAQELDIQQQENDQVFWAEHLQAVFDTWRELE